MCTRPDHDYLLSLYVPFPWPHRLEVSIRRLVCVSPSMLCIPSPVHINLFGVHLLTYRPNSPPRTPHSPYTPQVPAWSSNRYSTYIHIHCERRLRDPPSLRGRERRSEQHRLTHEHKAASPTKQVQKVVIAKSDVIAWAQAGARDAVTRLRAWRDARPQPPTTRRHAL